MNHNKFILTSITDILQDVISATAGIGNGIEAYPSYDYIIQSAFLKMTGAQEQKMKCIVWELATNNYEYRYDRFTKAPLGECSNYTDKKTIYKDLIEQIQKYDTSYSAIEKRIRNDILTDTREKINQLFSNTNLSQWSKRSYSEYQIISKTFTADYFAKDKDNLFTKSSNLSNKDNSIQEIYEKNLYKHRNRIAHNTLSFQQNLPTLTTLHDSKYRYNNYFIYFFILILIDNVCIHLYQKYLETNKNI